GAWRCRARIRPGAPEARPRIAPCAGHEFCGCRPPPGRPPADPPAFGCHPRGKYGRRDEELPPAMPWHRVPPPVYRVHNAPRPAVLSRVHCVCYSNFPLSALGLVPAGFPCAHLNTRPTVRHCTAAPHLYISNFRLLGCVRARPSRRQAVLGFDLEAIRLRPSGLGRTVGVESHHGPLQISVLEPETHVVKVHGGIQLGKFSKQSKHRDGPCPSPAANQISDIVAAKSFVVVYVVAHNDDPGG